VSSLACYLQSMAVMSLAHIFTGLSADVSCVTRGLASVTAKHQNGTFKQQRYGDTLCNSTLLASPTGIVSPKQKRLQEAEDERWLDVEGGSLQKWRSCIGCAFLIAADEPACEVCGMAAPLLAVDGHQEDVPHETNPEFLAPMQVTNQAPHTFDSGNDVVLLKEVVVAHNAPLKEEKAAVSRHNVILAVVRALDRSGADLLALADLDRFARIVYKSACWDRYSRSRRPVDVATEYGWDARKGTDVENFMRCISDEEGDWYCSTSALWDVLAQLDKLDGLIGDRSNTMAALRLGSALLELPPVAPLPAVATPDRPNAAIANASADLAKGSEDSAVSKGSIEDAEDDDEEGEEIPGTLDEAPPLGTEVKLLHDDHVWYCAKVVKVHGTVIEIVYDKDGEHDEVDVSEHACRLANYESDDDEECSEDIAQKGPSDKADLDCKSQEKTEGEESKHHGGDDKLGSDANDEDEARSEASDDHEASNDDEAASEAKEEAEARSEASNDHVASNGDDAASEANEDDDDDEAESEADRMMRAALRQATSIVGRRIQRRMQRRCAKKRRRACQALQSQRRRQQSMHKGFGSKHQEPSVHAGS